MSALKAQRTNWRKVVSNLEFDVAELSDRVKKLEERMAQKDVEFAVINTKLTAILWGVGVTGTAIIGVLIKMLFGA